MIFQDQDDDLTTTDEGMDEDGGDDAMGDDDMDEDMDDMDDETAEGEEEAEVEQLSNQESNFFNFEKQEPGFPGSYFYLLLRVII